MVTAEDLEQACTLGQSVDRQAINPQAPYMRRAVQGKSGSGKEGDWAGLTCISCLQLFRRVASALPGMENVQEKSKEGSILFLYHVSEKMTPQALELFSSVSR